MAYASRIPPPDLIVLIQSWPGQWSAAALEGLHRAWPLARLIVWLGSWCEGETRTGRPNPGVWRIFWYDFARRLIPYFQWSGEGSSSSWHLPRLATDLDRLVCELAGRIERADAPGARSPSWQGLVVIAARSREAYVSLSDACGGAGFATVWSPTTGSVRSVWRAGSSTTVGLWDALNGDEREWQQIASFAQRLAPASLLIALGFPRRRDADRATELGASVLAKPFQLPDLWYELQRATRTTSTINLSAGSVDPVNCSTL
jgi:hypothetical protein